MGTVVVREVPVKISQVEAREAEAGRSTSKPRAPPRKAVGLRRRARKARWTHSSALLRKAEGKPTELGARSRLMLGAKHLQQPVLLAGRVSATASASLTR